MKRMYLIHALPNNPAYDVEGLARHIADIYLPKSNEVQTATSSWHSKACPIYLLHS